MIKKVFKVLFFLFFVLFAIFLICFGFYIQNISSPKYIYKSGMSKVMNTFVDYLSYDNDYVFGDNFNIDGNLALNISNDVYKNKALYDSEYLKKNNLINNLSNMEINYRISQNRKSKQLFLSLNEQMENNIIFNGNYLVDDSTKYYLVNSIDKNYINAGNNNYFEMFGENETTISNFRYLYEFIIDSLSLNMQEGTVVYESNIDISDKDCDVRQISYKFTNDSVIKLFNSVVKDMKKDERANKIMSSIYPDFSGFRLSNNDNILKKNESYTLNIYTGKIFGNPLRYEVVYINGDNKKVYTYEGDDTSGIFYYSVNDEARYSAKYSSDNKNIKMVFFDRLSENVGKLVLSRDKNGVKVNSSMDIEGKSYDINYSSKNSNLLKHKSFDNQKSLTLKIINGSTIELSFDAILTSTISSDTDIREDISGAILKSTLSDDKKTTLQNLYDDVKMRLEQKY